MQVAIIGARGIGKQHAKWFHQEGCEVVAFAGRDPALLPVTALRLRELFPFAGRGYAEVPSMLAAEQPEVVVVASPHACHLEHLSLALDFGAHGYLEKPFAWSDDPPEDALLRRARALLDRADASGRLVGINTQYAGAWEGYLTLLDDATALARATSFAMEIESNNLGRHRGPEAMWVDLASHPISLLLKLLPDGCVRAEGARVTFRPDEAQARFVWANACGREVEAHFRCAGLDDGAPRRRFGVDGKLVTCEGANDEQGVFRATLTHAGQSLRLHDFMHAAIARFVHAVRTSEASHLVASGRDGLRNLEVHAALTRLAVWQDARPTTSP